MIGKSYCSCEDENSNVFSDYGQFIFSDDNIISFTNASNFPISNFKGMRELKNHSLDSNFSILFESCYEFENQEKINGYLVFRVIPYMCMHNHGIYWTTDDNISYEDGIDCYYLKDIYC